jgi:hypothetical protein
LPILKKLYEAMIEGARKMNAEVSQWGGSTTKDLKSEFSRLKILHVKRSPSLRPAVEILNERFSKQQGLINKIAFRFPRHMVFVHNGVGKGVPADFSGITSRKPKEWFNPIMDKNVEDLADIVASNQADIIADNLLIR